MLDEAAKQCGGFSALSLEATLSTPLTNNTTVTVVLYDDTGALVDQESGVMDDRMIDQQAGSGGINLIIGDVAPTHIAASINTLTQLGEGYRLVITTVDSGDTEAFDSGLIPTNCSQALAVGDDYGQTRLTNLVRLPAANDPLGPSHTPDLTTQRRSLETLLTEAGWSYTITTNAEDFTHELRTGGYVAYLLLSEQVKLEESAQKELREAVYRGEGLIEAGGYDQRQGRIDVALGVKFQGKHSRMQGFSLIDNSVTPFGDADFHLIDRTLRAATDGASVFGTFVDRGAVTTETAMTRYSYGQGRSIYIGFDLAAESALATTDLLLDILLLDALVYVHPETLPLLVQGMYPLRISLDNLGVATPGQVILTLSSGVSVLDSGIATVNAQSLIWPFHLAEPDQLTLDAWIKLPEEPVLITALIQSGIASDWVDQDIFFLKLAPEALMTVQVVSMHADEITDKAYKQVQKYLGWAEEDSLAGRWSAALSALLRASDALVVINTPESAALRVEVAEAIRTVAINMKK